MLEVAHALRQRLHFAQALVHLLQPLGHLFEALAQTRLQRGLEFFIHRGTHFIKLGGVGGLQLGQLGFQRLANLGHTPRVGLGHLAELGGQRVRQRLLHQRELLAKGVDLRILGARGLGTLLHQRLLESGQVLAQFLASTAGRFGDFGAQLTLQALGSGLQLDAQVLQLFALQLLLQVIAIAPLRPCQPDQRQQVEQGHAQQGPDPPCHIAQAITSGFKGVRGLPCTR